MFSNMTNQDQAVQKTEEPASSAKAELISTSGLEVVVSTEKEPNSEK